MITAYCAPGRESVTAILLAYQDIEFDGVRASVMMAGREDIILIDDEAVNRPFARARDALYELERTADKSDDAVRAYFRNYVPDIPLTGNSFRMLSS